MFPALFFFLLFKEKLKGLFEEDILIDEARRPEVEEWINGITTTKRAAMIGDVRWPKNTLYYQFNPSFMHCKLRNIIQHKVNGLNLALSCNRCLRNVIVYTPYFLD